MATAHALVGIGMTREALYVAATRAREANRLYVDVEPDRPGPRWPTATRAPEAREVLVAVASRRGADLSAHQTMASEWARAASFDQLVKEHQSLVAAAMARRWESGNGRRRLAGRPSGPGSPVPRVGRPAQGAAGRGGPGARRRARPAGAGQAPGGPGEDPAALLRARLRRWEKLTGGNWQPRQDLVAGLVPRASRIDDLHLAKAVAEREHAIAKRALDLAEHADTVACLGQTLWPATPRPVVAQAWWDRLAVVAAYRDRWGHHRPEHPR